jgi:uncharacterized protein (TIGR02996 family)
MSEEDGFIRAILAAPRDLSLRLVYADWLEERGDRRGEYLRLLAALDGLASGDAGGEECRERLRELEDEIDPHWVAKMLRGRLAQADEGSARAKGRGRRRKREVLEADIGRFLRQYRRKACKKRLERLMQRMRPEDLDRLMRGEER